ncbi:MAG: hypothetical protein K2N21_07245, partial [Rikenellaceae bacterium]|nr:hypothetical protein [Rikenellaceae bacterium]
AHNFLAVPSAGSGALSVTLVVAAVLLLLFLFCFRTLSARVLPLLNILQALSPRAKNSYHINV